MSEEQMLAGHPVRPRADRQDHRHDRGAAADGRPGRQGSSPAAGPSEPAIEDVSKPSSTTSSASASRPPASIARADQGQRTARARSSPSLLPEEGEPKYTPADVGRAFDALEERVVRDLILEGKRIDGRGAQAAARDLLRGRRAAADARLGPLPARRNAGPGDHHARHRQRRAARRRPERRDTARSSCSTTTSRRSASASAGRSAAPAGARSATAPWPSAASRPSSPAPDKFPYTIRVVSDILESNGSSAAWPPSAAAPCRSWTPACRSATRSPASRSAWSRSRTSSSLLTDIMGDEDHFGDMDFKVAGTGRGITGIQLDLKIDGINEEIIQATLEQAREARREILKTMRHDAAPAARPRSAGTPRGCSRSRSTRRRSAC